MSLILMNNKKDKIITNSKRRLSDLVDVKAKLTYQQISLVELTT